SYSTSLNIRPGSTRCCRTVDYEKFKQEGDSDESDDEEEAVHQSHVVVSKEAIYKANNTGMTSSKEKKKSKFQHVIRSMKKQQRISSDRDSNSNYYSPLSSLKDPHGFVEKLFSRLQTCNKNEDFESGCPYYWTSPIKFIELLSFPSKPHQRDITNLLAAAIQACQDMVPPEAVEPLFKQTINQFVHDKLRTEGCESEDVEAQVGFFNKGSDRLIHLWAHVHSKSLEDVQLGITMFEGT
nr:protein SDA1 homolog [Tanacetum cinerariifolium]